MASFTARKSTVINASAEQIWRALTDPETVKKIMWGTEITSDWKVGSPITYKGIWEGRTFEDTGIILEIVPNQILKTTYRSTSYFVISDHAGPATITYHITPESCGQTKISITQDQIISRITAEYSEDSWGVALGTMKKLLETPRYTSI